MAVKLKGMPIEKKVEIVGRVIRDYAKHKFTQAILENIQPKGWQDIFFFVKNTLKYRRELPGKDVLYEPPEALGRVEVDCEDYTALLGSLLMAAGYPVRLKVISNATYHIYPEIGLPPDNPRRWIGLDATTGLVGEVIYPPHYKPFLTKELSGGVTRSWAPLEITKEISLDEPVKPGDHLRFHYKSYWFVPDTVEKWLYSKLMDLTHPNFRVLSVKKVGDEWIVDVRVTKGYELGALITVAVIASALAVGAIATYFALTKVEKVIEVGKTPINLAAIALVLFGVAAIAKEAKEKG